MAGEVFLIRSIKSQRYLKSVPMISLKKPGLNAMKLGRPWPNFAIP
jgi:hypothetical protein